jgi:predicted CXXCH cytochrome family protein
MEFLKYPLQGGKLACLTCHLPHGGRTREQGGGFSLRGEPYRKMTDFCLKCHEEKSWSELNAHDQLTPQGDMIRRTCLMCHPAEGEAAPPAEFNDTLTAICTQCHDPFPHPEGIEHVSEPGPAMEADMKAYEKRREVRLPLDTDGRITCATCHNPHERGLLTGPDSIGADEKHRIRLTSFNEICTPCHGRH